MLNFVKLNWKPIVFAISLFFSISAIYFTPTFQSKVLQQHDILVWKSSAKEASDFKKETR